jgi:2'-5' RNA ligase
MRAFFCLELEPKLKEELDRITQKLRRGAPVKASWVRRENLHVTLKFLGEIEEELVPRLEAAAQEALSRSEITGPVEWELDRLGAFPSVERPRVIWVGPAREPEPLGQLALRLQEALQPLGFEPERDRFVTHITLGRIKERGPSVEPLTRALRSFQPFHHPARADGLTLMESLLTPQGATYTPVFRVPFFKGDGGDAL